VTGIDTNVLVRYITRDDPEQHRTAKAYLESTCTPEEPGYVSVIVVCELARVLDSAYDATDADIADVIDQLLRTHQLRIERRDRVRAALNQYTRHAADFPDCLLGQISQFQSIPLNRKTCTQLSDVEVEGVADATGAHFLPMTTDADVEPVLDEARTVAAGGRPVVVDVHIDYRRRTQMTKGVVKTNLLG